uniref:Hydroxyproline O-arabinosyltransferase-like domain-containing protein n=1 Tax=Pyrodinium bahamense TaxID=73915 RepID=A0A7S0AG01_9DINO|mmetsp:Transcript_33893/g.93727  ORF Transcript_33893/g.93727 Transcript_33893/m.93727 type:complete len:501 (+) Transcript_33893:60-1562(+)
MVRIFHCGPSSCSARWALTVLLAGGWSILGAWLLLFSSETLLGGLDRAVDQTVDLLENVHVIWTTDCRAYQHWQSVVLEHSWFQSKHPGAITRIVSGCSDWRARARVRSTAIQHPKWSVHFAPSYVGTDADLWKALNRPPSIQHWLNHTAVNEEVIVILDPDFIILHPFMNHVREPLVHKGLPLSQKWPLEDAWHPWQQTVCPHCNLSLEEIVNNYSSGPPWIIHIDDLRKMLPRWIEHCILSETFRKPGYIYMEQLAFSSALAAVGLPQRQVNNLQASWPVAFPASEAWEAWQVDSNWKGSNLAPEAARCFHYHQWLELGPWKFHKGHVPGLHGPADEFILHCDAPLLLEPPHWQGLFWHSPDIPLHQWGLKVVFQSINTAVTTYKGLHCRRRRANLQGDIFITDLNVGDLSDHGMLRAALQDIYLKELRSCERDGNCPSACGSIHSKGSAGACGVREWSQIRWWFYTRLSRSEQDALHRAWEKSMELVTFSNSSGTVR